MSHYQGTVSERVKALIVEEHGYSSEEVQDDSNLLHDLAFDSLGVVELLMNLEEEFGIPIEDTEFEEVKTVGDVIKVLEGKVGQS